MKKTALLRLLLSQKTKAEIRIKDFSGIDFSGSNFPKSNFFESDFSESNFSESDFSGSDFSGSNFLGSNFSGIYFSGSNFIKIIINERTLGLTINCPEKGSFTAWKKALYGNEEECIIELFIPVSAKRSSATSYKCRCSKAKVVKIYDMQGNKIDVKAYSLRDKYFIYEVGKVVSVDDYDENRWDECSTGIHFFVSRKMAECFNM